MYIDTGHGQAMPAFNLYYVLRSAHNLNAYSTTAEKTSAYVFVFFKVRNFALVTKRDQGEPNVSSPQGLNNPPEERFSGQLEQLASMGFVDRQANIQGESGFMDTYL